MHAVTIAVFVLASSIWIGGYVTIAVVARSATASLPPAARVTFFRTLGRTYLKIGLSALLVALAAGAILASEHKGDALLNATIVAVVLLLFLLAIAVAQARRMSQLRSNVLDEAEDTLVSQVRRGARTAAVLRAALGVLTLIILVLGSFLAA